MNRNTIAAAPPLTSLAYNDVSTGSVTTGLAAYLGTGAVWLVVGFLTISTFEGTLRFYAASAGVPWVIYVKDLLLIGALAFGTVATLLTDMRNLAFLTVLALIVLGTFVGCVVLPDLRQPLFAAKTWLPLLCGTVVAQSMTAHPKLLLRSLTVLWIAAVAGVFLTWQWPAPWVGFTYEVGGVAIEGSRQWSIGDVDRVPGFSRASFDAALQCIFFGAVIAAFARHYMIGLLIWMVSGAAIYLTLSRSALAGVVVVAVVHAAISSGRMNQRLVKVLVVALAVAVVALPFAAQVYYKNKAEVMDMSTVSSTSSFAERAMYTWPRGLALVERGGNWVTGRGFGGIGIAQQFYEPEIFNAGDNLFVYLWGALGLLGLVPLALMAWQTWRARVPVSPWAAAGMMVVSAYLAVGFTLNGIEAAVPSLILGIGLVWLSRQRAEEAFD